MFDLGTSVALRNSGSGMRITLLEFSLTCCERVTEGEAGISTSKTRSLPDVGLAMRYTLLVITMSAISMKLLNLSITTYQKSLQRNIINLSKFKSASSL
jgi:hypothetical protein